MSKLNLVTVVGHDTGILYHMIKYYKQFVDRIYIIIYLNETENDYILNNVKELGIEPYKVIVANKFDWKTVTMLYNVTKMIHPEDWWIVADVDEFQIYPDSIDTIIKTAEQKQYKFVTGGFLDRLGTDGTFPIIEQDTSIWKQFPLGGFFRYPLSGACPNKVTLMKGFVEITEGQHYAKINNKTVWGTEGIKHPWRYPIEEVFTQVHHFKWDRTVLTRLNEVASTKNKNTYWNEYRKMYHALRRKDRIDISDSRFGFEKISSYFNDYSKWPLLTKKITQI